MLDKRDFQGTEGPTSCLRKVKDGQISDIHNSTNKYKQVAHICIGILSYFLSF